MVGCLMSFGQFFDEVHDNHQTQACYTHDFYASFITRDLRPARVKCISTCSFFTFKIVQIFQFLSGKVRSFIFPSDIESHLS